MTWAVSAYVLDEEDMESHPAWFWGAKNMPPMGAGTGVQVVRIVEQGFLWAADKLSLPTTKGVLWRIKDNTTYVTVLPITSEQEVKEREGKFRQAIAPFIERWDELYDGWMSELTALYKPLKELDLEKASNMELVDAFIEADRVSRRMSDIHFRAMYGIYGIYMLFEDTCKQLLGIDDTNPSFQSVVRGFDNKTFEGDAWLWRLSQQALELGLGGLLQSMPATELPSRLKDQAAGKKWLEELAEYLDEFGWKNKQGWHYASPAWREDLSLPLEKVQGYIRAPEFNLADTRKALAEERERTAKELISRVPEDKREWFSLLMAGAQHAGSFSEDHNFYCEGFNDAVMRRILLAIGRRFAAAGAFDRPDDIFVLGPEEVQKVGAYAERYNLRPIVSSRRAAWEEHLKPDHQFPPVISKKLSTDEAFGWMVSAHDPIFEKCMIGALPAPRPELKADLLGIPGSPGVAEGVARVLFSPEDLLQVQPGEILICPSTDVTWTPVFALLKAVVVDMGGSLCHAAIVSREYGIPCVLNTFAGTGKIKNGQRVRVDGNTGAVYIMG